MLLCIIIANIPVKQHMKNIPKWLIIVVIGYTLLLVITNPIVGERATINQWYIEGRMFFYWSFCMIAFVGPVIEEFLFRGWIANSLSLRLRVASICTFTLAVINELSKLFAPQGLVARLFVLPVVINNNRFVYWSQLFGTINALDLVVETVNDAFWLLTILVSVVIVYRLNFFRRFEQIFERRKEIVFICVSVLFFVVWHYSSWIDIGDRVVAHLVFGTWFTFLALKKTLKTAILGHSFHNITMVLSYALPFLSAERKYIDILITSVIWVIVTCLFVFSYRKNSGGEFIQSH